MTAEQRTQASDWIAEHFDPLVDTDLDEVAAECCAELECPEDCDDAATLIADVTIMVEEFATCPE